MIQLIETPMLSPVSTPTSGTGDKPPEINREDIKSAAEYYGVKFELKQDTRQSIEQASGVHIEAFSMPTKVQLIC